MKEGERIKKDKRWKINRNNIAIKTEKIIILKLDSGYKYRNREKNIISSKTIDKESKTSKNGRRC